MEPRLKIRQSKITLPRAVHSRHPFPPIRDAAYRQHVGGGLTTDTGNRNKKIGKDRLCGSGGDILADTQTHRKTYSSITILRNCS